MAARSRPTLSMASRPRLARHARFRFNEARERWVILVPERVLLPDEIAVEVLKLCDGARSIEEVVGELASRYQAAPEVIAGDCLKLLQDLAHKGHLIDASEVSP